MQRGVTYEKLIKGVSYEGLIRGVDYDEEAPVKKTILTNKVEDQQQGKTFISEQSCEGLKFESIKKSDVEIEIMRDLNFRLKLRKKTVEVSDSESGEVLRFLYDIEIITYALNGKIKIFDARVEGKDVKKHDWVNNATQGLASLPKDKIEKELFQNMVQICIETEDVPVEVIYPNAGWRNVLNLGMRYVYADGMVGVADELVHSKRHMYKLNVKKEKLGKRQTFFDALAMGKICRNCVASTELLLFAHMGTLTTLFELAGCPINFVMGVVGVTNSRKTSMALVISKIFDRERMIADAEFTATACGIEKTLGTYKDGVVIIDDFKPGVNRAQQYALDQKLDQLVRYYGNRITKKRMNDYQADAEKKYFPINGVCVMTMEVVTGVTSSLSRMFLTEIGIDDVDNQMLLFYQQNSWVLPTHIYDFLNWITQCFEEVVVYIAETFPKFRASKNFEMPRYCEMYAMMMTTATIIVRYACERNFWDNYECEQYIGEVEQIVANELQSMAVRIRNRDKGKVMIMALTDALITGKISPVVLTPETAPNRCGCYQDEKLLFIQTRRLLQVVNQYCKDYSLNCEIINEDEAISLLQRLQVLELIEENGKRICSRKLPIQRGNTLRYLYIRKEKVADLCSE